MPEDTTNTPVINPPTNNEKVNAEIAAKQAAQDIMGHSTSADPTTDTGDALDALAKQVTENPKGPKSDEPEPGAGPTGPNTPTDDAPTGATGPSEEEIKKAAEDKAKADALFKDSPSLPPGASSKSSEAFVTVKIKAAQEVAARDAQIEKLSKELATFKEQAGKPSPEQLAKESELEEHRKWRAKLDVDFDPKFKEFDKTIESSREFIYAQLRESPVVTDAVIEQIKKFGGPDKTNLSKLFESMQDPTLQRVIESKISDIKMAGYSKNQAIKAAKDNVSQYVNDRETELKSSATKHVTETKTELDRLLPNLTWFKPQTAKSDATPEEKAKVEDHNKFVSELQEQVNIALTDNSPQMRAVLITGMTQLFNTQREAAGLRSQLEGTKKELETLQGKWNKVVNSSRTRLNESGAPSNAVPAPKKTDDFTTPTTSALDNIAKQVMEEREKRNAAI